ISTNGSFTYTPDGTFTGSDSFTYKDTANGIDSNTATVTITDHAPVAAAETYGVLVNHTLTVLTASGTLANDTDADADTLSTTLVTNVSHGSLTLNSDGSFTYTPTTNYTG